MALPRFSCSHEPVTDDKHTGTPVGRRVVLGMLGVGAVGVLVGRPAQQAIQSAVGATMPGLGAVIPAAGGFRIYTVTGGYPSMDPASYRLDVSGAVTRSLSLSMADIKDLPQTQMTKDFQCVTGWRVDDVPWSGVLLRDILAAAGADRAATALRFFSFDGAYTESLTMEQSLRDDVLVATTMYGAPLTREHGGPVRLYVAPMYGYKSIKWLSGIEVVGEVVPGYWEQRGYDIDAWVGASNGRNDEPIV